MTGDWLLDFMIVCIGIGGISLLVLRTPLYTPVLNGIAWLFGLLPQYSDRVDYVEQLPIASVSKAVPADTNAVPVVLGTSTVPVSIASVAPGARAG